MHVHVYAEYAVTKDGYIHVSVSGGVHTPVYVDASRMYRLAEDRG